MLPSPEYSKTSLLIFSSYHGPEQDLTSPERDHRAIPPHSFVKQDHCLVNFAFARSKEKNRVWADSNCSAVELSNSFWMCPKLKISYLHSTLSMREFLLNACRSAPIAELEGYLGASSFLSLYCRVYVQIYLNLFLASLLAFALDECEQNCPDPSRYCVENHES